MSIHCPQCNVSNDDQALVCSNCGAEITEGKQEVRGSLMDRTRAGLSKAKDKTKQVATGAASTVQEADLSGKGAAAWDKTKQSAKGTAKSIQEADLVGKSATAMDATKRAAEKTGQFVVEHQETAREVGKIALNTTKQVGDIATKVGTVATTAHTSMIVVAVAAGVCALSGVAYVIVTALK